MDFWVQMLIAAAVGAALTIWVIVSIYKLVTHEWWEGNQVLMQGLRSRLDSLVAENAKLRVALATGVMSEDGRKVAAMMLAALNTAIDTGKVQMERCYAFNTPDAITEKVVAAVAEYRVGQKALDGSATQQSEAAP